MEINGQRARCADDMTPYIRISWHYIHQQTVAARSYTKCTQKGLKPNYRSPTLLRELTTIRPLSEFYNNRSCIFPIMESNISDTKSSSTISVIPVDINNFSSTLQLTENEPSQAKPPESYNPFEKRIVEHPNSSSISDPFCSSSQRHRLPGTSPEMQPRNRYLGYAPRLQERWPGFRHGGHRSGRLGLHALYPHTRKAITLILHPTPEQDTFPGTADDAKINIRLYILMIFPFVCALGLIRNLKYLVPVSAIANLLMGVGFTITFYYIFTGIPSPTQRDYVASPGLMPMFFCTVIFAMEGIGVVMPLENSMKNPGHFLGCPGVLNAGMFVVVTLYAIIGFFGYLKYGESTNASVTLNLPSEHAMAQVVKILIAVAILFTYGLQFFIATDITWPMLEKHVDKRWSSTLQNLYRILTVAITVCVAIAVPNLGPIISLVGAVCYSTLGLLCPVMIDLVTNWEGGLGTWYWVLWKDSFIILFWLAALLTGTYTSVLDIITIDAGAVAHMLKGSIGTGILAMPNAFMNAGLVVGAVGTVVVGFVCFHCVHILVKSSHILCKREKIPSLDYAETAELAFKTGPVRLRHLSGFCGNFVKWTLICGYYTALSVYVVFIATSIKQVTEKGNDFNIRLYILMLLPFLCALGLIRNLRYLVPFSTLANLFIVGGFTITLYYLFTDIPSPDERNYSGSPAGLPIFFSTVIFAMEGIGVVMPLENSMKNPSHFLGCPGVLNVTMAVVVLLFGVMGFVGYLKFGENTRASITLNLPTENILAQTAKLLIAASILLTFGLQFFVPTDISWPMIEKNVCDKWKNILQNVYRISMVTAIVLLATAVPNLGPIISLVGSVVYSIIGLLCPAVIETATCWESGLGRWNWLLWKNLLIIMFSLVALVTGTYISVGDIIKQY
uniref:Amino acid transporter transmembrane domain-containing protein n=1 Tax=Timema bartmani TaxID=61472 RepID=A0A7R9HXR7_9NEOP|nr:unnamed protein product [Timema bartmani]